MCTLVEVHRRFIGITVSIITAMKAITLMMEAVNTSETLMYLHKTTQRSTPEGCHHLVCYNILKDIKPGFLPHEVP
jgi:hypothetical protein